MKEILKKRKMFFLIESTLLENEKNLEETNTAQRSMLKKVLDGVKKTKNDAKTSIIKIDLSPKEKVEKRKKSEQLNEDAEEHLTSVEKLRRSMHEGSKWFIKVLDDAKARVSKTDKQNQGNNEETENVTSAESSCLESNKNSDVMLWLAESPCIESNEKPEETKDVMFAESIKNDELSGEKTKEDSAKESLIGNEEKSVDPDSSLFTYCENSGEIQNVFLTESSLYENEDQSVESSLLGYCEKSGEIKNIAILENGEQDQEAQNDQHPKEIETSVQSGNFHKVLDSVVKVLDGPTEEEMVIPKRKSKAVKIGV